MMVHDVAAQVRRGAQAVHVTLAQAEVAEVLARIKRAEVAAGKLPSYAFVAGRNRAIQTMRDAQRRADMAARQAAQDEAQARAAVLDRDAEAEFCRALVRLAGDPRTGATNWRVKCEVVGRLVAGQNSVPEIMVGLKITRDVVYQWRKRVLDRIIPDATDNLRRWLKARKNGNKQATNATTTGGTR